MVRINSFWNRCDRAMLIALCPFFIFSVILLGHQWVPTHDTLNTLMVSHFFFGNIQRAEIPIWSPYTDWGKDFGLLFLLHFSPSALFLAPLVKVFKIHIASFFYLSCLVDEFLFLSGCYLLGRRLYKNSETVLWLCFALAGTAIWASQIHPSFRLYYMVPLAFYWIVLAGDTGRFLYLLLSTLLLTITSMLGNSLYYGLIPSVCCAIFFVLCRKKVPLRIGAREAIVLTGIVLSILLPCVLVLYGTKPSILSAFRGHDGAITYDNFLHYGLGGDDKSPFAGLLSGLENPRDVTVYGGILLLPCLLLAAFSGYSSLMLALAGVLLFLFLFWLGPNSFLAPFLYHLPIFNIIRHIGLFSPLLKVIMAFIAGFGLDAWIGHLRQSDEKSFRRGTWLLIASLSLFSLLVLKDFKFPLAQRQIWVLVLYGGVLLLLVRSLWTSQVRRWLPALLVGLTCLDAYSFRSALYHERMVAVSDHVWRLFRPRRLAWSSDRVENYFDHPAFEEVWRILYRDPDFTADGFWRCQQEGDNPRCREWRGGKVAVYNSLEQFLDFSPCFSIFKTNDALPWVDSTARLLVSGEKRSRYPEGFLIPPDNLRPVIACGEPKLQLVKGLFVLPNKEALKAALDDPRFSGNILLTTKEELDEYEMNKPRLFAGAAGLKAVSYATGPAPSHKQALRPSLTSERPWALRTSQIQVTHFSPNRLVVDATAPPGDYWLYYSDAWHPFWKATVDGSPVPILRANLAFKAVKIPLGSTHRVEFVYSSHVKIWTVLMLWCLSTVFMSGVIFWLVRRTVFLPRGNPASMPSLAPQRV